MKLQITQVSKTYGQRKVLNNLSFEMTNSEIVGLFGRNGSGKSTLLQLLFGTLRADTIRIQIDDKNVKPRAIIPRQLIGYLPQHTFLPMELSVRNIVPLYFKDAETLDRIFYAPAVASFESRSVGALSGGQRKYLELLLVAHLPHPFLLLDEPFAMIDPLYQEYIKVFLRELQPKKGILVTDHYYQDVLAVANRNYLMKDGKMSIVNGAQELQAAGYLPNRK